VSEPVTDPASPSPVLPERFRELMGRWATGVSVVTAHDPSGDAGLTVNALLSVALQPASLLVSLQKDVDTLPVLRRSGAFGVSFLAADQRDLSSRFARAVPSAEKFAGVRVHRGVTGVPLLDGALATVECRLVSESPAYDHLLLVGEVVAVEGGAEVAPLVFYRGAYGEADGPDRLRFSRRTA
jgi:3-hydroxy-9,10-secoandrosta-1,3,5(10)-triene-9,17-dione monooxygenase reductase component